ncbi:fumarylacetoacetate hydrolase family protein [Pseudoduganella namucuonensis]|uniref:2-keto-4-pentenoate hydratase/2-oxohepta-3-ene-1,7-dioic acid hydratase (Catechol pathway) n=1 Tax=Pseudoduganella namucuonensis TaxID=1035707 RepID=A0A1I7LMW4_9BURK|nr:fumarylacetoacetate hydrolase family protein [Pseudoduganella namucuonensis]SFV11047.1 2-keto-4-pentenoate hydratase/2-oxohepta-3-ene-1,7-dioic acid hydratase (catechol pathway) [Pseudoduganella namucuonensis]
MAIQVVHFLHQDSPAWGVVHGRRVAPLSRRYDGTAGFVGEGLEEAWASTPAQASLELDTLHLLSPVSADRQFLCQGINYASHVRESGMDPDKIGFNTLFTKASSSLAPARADIVRPSHVRLLDYEVELGLVMRRPVTGPVEVTPDRLHEWLAGVTIVNDISARDVQLPQTQFYKGKSYRGFGPTGPFLLLLTPDEWRRWPELRMRLLVNGQLRQDAYCGDMIFKPHQTLTELSALHDLQAGDLIATGTPAGCAARAPGKLAMWMMRHVLSDATKWRLFIQKGLSNPAYLQPGDVITAAIRSDDGALDLGEQRNRVVAP